MRIFALKTARLAFVPVLAQAYPLLRLFGKDIEPASEHLANSPPAPIARIEGWRPTAEAGPSALQGEDGVANLAPTSPYVGGNTISHSPTSPFQPPTWSSLMEFTRPFDAQELGHDPDMPSSSRIISFARNQNVAVIAPQIDLQFSTLLQDPERKDWLKLPFVVDYIHSPWITQIYKNIIESLPYTKRFDPEAAQIFFPDAQIATIATKRGQFFPRGEAYRLQVPTQWLRAAGLPEPLELLVRYHYKIRYQKGYTWSTVSFWSTAEAGSKLALLGIFHISKQGWASVQANYREWQKLQIVSKIGPADLMTKLYLAPVPSQGS